MNLHPGQYVPILLAKRGERRGVADLDNAVKVRLTPMFVIPPVEWDFEADGPRRTTEEHIDSAGRDIAECWGTSPAFVDPYFLDNGAPSVRGTHPLDFIIGQANDVGATLIPTVSTSRDAAYRNAVAQIAARDRRGACVRLGIDEWPSAVGQSSLDDLLRDIGLSPADLDLMLDTGEEVAAAPHLAITSVRAEMAALPYLADWRAVIIAGAGFPRSMEGVAQGISIIDRADWQVYASLVNGPALPRTPVFTDYAVAHPDPVRDVDPRFMSISAAFRYTIDDAWLVAKGALFKGRAGTGQGGAAMVPVAQRLVSDARFAGVGHCAGDAWLDQTANDGSGGNPEAWRRAATTHHLTHVPVELANLHGSSGGPVRQP